MLLTVLAVTATIALLVFLELCDVAAKPPFRHQQEHSIVARKVLEDSTTAHDFVVWFPHICCLLTSAEEQLFAQLTREYLDIVDQRSSTLSSFIVLGQNLESMDKLPLTKTILIMPSGESVLEEYLAKNVGLAVHARTDTGSLTISLFAPTLSKHWEDYVNYLVLGGLRQFDSSYTQNSPESKSNGTDLSFDQSHETMDAGAAWIAVALTFGVLALVAVIVARWKGGLLCGQLKFRLRTF